jgi:6-phospho-beta-glucosidase
VPIAVLGGSSAFLPSLAAALAERRSDLPALRVRLQGRDAKRTGTVAEFCSRYAASVGAPHRFTATTRASVAARDAAIVVNQVRIGGFAGRSRDEQLALEYGYPGDETIGPSGLSAAIRSLPPILALAKEVERVAPDAWFIQMSNPMSILLGGLLERTGLKTFRSRATTPG